MFARFRKESVFVARVLDTPLPIIIEKESLTAQVPGSPDKILIIRGRFEHISDADAFFKVRKQLDKLGVA